MFPTMLKMAGKYDKIYLKEALSRKQKTEVPE